MTSLQMPCCCTRKGLPLITDTNKQMKPLISIVIAVYNAHAEIGQCLDSIFRNKWPFFEVIIVDDASTDNSIEIVNNYDCRVFRSELNHGPAYARNLGVSKANADIVLFLDADTEVLHNALELYYNDFLNNPELLAVIGIPSPKSLRRGRASDYNALRNHFTLLSAEPITDYFTTQMGAIRKQAFYDVGGFSEKYRHADIEDYELGLRLPPNTILIDKKIIINHHFPSFISIFSKYFRRASLLASLTMERKRLAKAHSNLKRVVSVCSASLAILFLPLTAISGYFWFYAGFACMVMVTINLDLLHFVAKERGFFYLFEFIFFELVFSLAISAGGLLCRLCKC